jgi:ABC-type maltose transport system permease subunit
METATDRGSSKISTGPGRLAWLSLKNRKLNCLIVYGFLIIYAILVLVPVVVIISASLDPAGLPRLISDRVTFEHCTSILQNP